jgi:hypothetical protein
MRALCGSEHLADVCLVVSGKRMPAHRHVLAPHSRVFERMWSHSMAEVCHSPSPASLPLQDTQPADPSSSGAANAVIMRSEHANKVRTFPAMHLML